MENKLKDRKDIDESLTWDLSHIYKDDESLEKDIDSMIKLSEDIEKKYQGKLNTSCSINRALDDLRVLEEYIAHISNYVELALSVDHTNEENQERCSRVFDIISDVRSQLSFIDSEIIQNDDEVLEEAAKKSKENRNYIKNKMREKPHMLHPEAEKVLKEFARTFDSPYEIYEESKLSDMDFENFTVEGKEYPLGYALFENQYEYDNNTKVRRAAFKAFSDKLSEYQNTTAAVYKSHVQIEKTLADLRGFDSVIDSLLFEQHVDEDLYNRQIDLITEKLAPHMRKYARLIKKVHNLNEMTFADLKISIDPEYDPTVSIEESKEYIENGLKVLGPDYLDMVKRAYSERWVDFANNKGKTTGGFCASPYKKNSYILLSWSNKMSEVFTLAHELGHAGNFMLSDENQNIFDRESSLYFVEAPSTMNELLMANYLLKSSDDKRFRRWVLSSLITNTYYHNFVTHLLEAAYQREVYKIIDKGGNIHASLLNKIKKNVLEKFWGDDVKIIDGAERTWMRQPHYYLGLYSYSYSASLTIATEVSKRILKEGQPAIDDWMEVLKAGGSKTPVELAKMVGVDITTDTPLLDTIDYIGSIIDEIIKLTDEL